jgi:hypothetical protein
MRMVKCKLGIHSPFCNGCPKRSDAKRQTGAWYIAHLKQKREQYAMYRGK